MIKHDDGDDDDYDYAEDKHSDERGEELRRHTPERKVYDGDNDHGDGSDIQAVKDVLKKNNPKQKRQEEQCPFLGCQGTSTRIKRHLEMYHKLTPEAASKMMQRNASYLRHSRANQPSELRLTCKLCASKVKSLDMHYNKCHRMDKFYAKKEMWRAQRYRKLHTLSSEDRLSHTKFLKTNKAEERGKHAEKAVYNYDKLEQKKSSLSSTPQVLSLFGEWLGSMKGGKRSDKTSSLYVTHSERLIEELGGKIEHLRDYADLASPRGFFDQLLKEGVKPTTVKVYLSSLKALFQFLGSTASDEFPPTFISQAVGDVSKYMSSMSKEVTLRRHKVKEAGGEAMDKIIPNMKEYINGPNMRKALKLLNKSGSVPSTIDFTLMRNHFITLLLLQNGQRTGTVSGLTVEDANNGIVAGDSFVAKIDRSRSRKRF